VQGRSYICKLWSHKTALSEYGVSEITAPQAVAKGGYSGTSGAVISWTPHSEGVSPWMITCELLDEAAMNPQNA
jgi:hypothetical protein